MNQMWAQAKVADNGRLSIPANQRKLLGLEHGGQVVLAVDRGVLMVKPVAQLLDDIQAKAVQLLGPSDGGEVDRFLGERRTEAAGEQQD